jgi:hypothetical protein
MKLAAAFHLLPIFLRADAHGPPRTAMDDTAAPGFDGRSGSTSGHFQVTAGAIRDTYVEETC